MKRFTFLLLISLFFSCKTDSPQGIEGDWVLVSLEGDHVSHNEGMDDSGSWRSTKSSSISGYNMDCVLTLTATNWTTTGSYDLEVVLGEIRSDTFSSKDISRTGTYLMESNKLLLEKSLLDFSAMSFDKSGGSGDKSAEFEMDGDDNLLINQFLLEDQEGASYDSLLYFSIWERM